jgi:carbon monoxide dehydrogenase subunit G
MADFSFERKLNFPRADVWPLIGDFTKSPGPEIKVEVEKEGDKAAAGAGTIRTITIGKVRVREVLETANPPSSFTYRIIGGAPMKEYKADVTFRESDGATVIRWDACLKPKFPLTGSLCCLVAKGAANKLLDAVEKALRAGCSGRSVIHQK